MSLKAQIEAIIYVADEPVTMAQLFVALRGDLAQPPPVAPGDPQLDLPAPEAPTPIGPTIDDIKAGVEELLAEYHQDSRGIEIKEVAGGYKMATKPEHHEGVRKFVKSLKPPMKLSLAALETLAVIAYRQPVTAPEIGDVRGVNTGGVLKTLLDKRLITTAGRKNVIGRPILYRTTKDFLVQFGLKDVSELPSLKEFEELARSVAPEAAADAAPEA